MTGTAAREQGELFGLHFAEPAAKVGNAPVLVVPLDRKIGVAEFVAALVSDAEGHDFTSSPSFISS